MLQIFQALYTGNKTSVDVSIYGGYKGSGRSRAFNAKDLKNKKGKITISNDDNRCMVRAIAVGNAIINKEDPKKLKSLKNAKCKTQLHEAMNIINECKLNDDNPYDIEDLKLIAEHIKKNIAVVDRERLNQIVYKTEFTYNKT